VRGRVLAALIGCCSIAYPASAQYRFDPYTTSNGLPQNTVAAVLQSGDGYLWIATYDGLVRYDGVRFTTLDKGNTPVLRSTQFLSLFEDTAGTLWAGTVDGGVVRYRDGRFTALGTREGLARAERIQESPRGVLLFHSAAQASLVTADARISPADDEARSVFAAPSRAVWTRASDARRRCASADCRRRSGA
jgi:ligand-binding sensor domain-containing protein